MCVTLNYPDIWIFVCFRNEKTVTRDIGGLQRSFLFTSTDSLSIPDVKNVNVNMSLGLTLTRMPTATQPGLMVRVFTCV